MAETEIKKGSKKSKRKKATKYVVSILVMVLVTSLALYYILSGDTAAIFNALGNAKATYVFIMVGLIVSAWLLEGGVLTLFSKMYRKKYRIYQGVLNGLIGSFFSAITPFASGGQFVQVYTFSRQGIKPADSASILVMTFIVSQTVIVIYGTLAIIFGFQNTIAKMTDLDFFGRKVSPFIFSIIGYIINFFSIASLFLLSFCRPIHRFVLNTVIGIGAKLHLVKDPDRKKAALAAQVATFRIELIRLFKNSWVLLIALVLEFAKFSCFNMLPYFAGLSLGADMSGAFLTSIWSNSYVSMITTFIPIPGASGGAEAGFQILFRSIYNSESITSAANILTRCISYYMSLFVGLCVFTFYRGSPKGEKVLEYDNKKTFVDLQIVSFANVVNSEHGEKPLPSLREVTIVPFTDEEDKTLTCEIKPEDIVNSKDKIDDDNFQTVHIKKKKIWPWSRGKGNSVQNEDQKFMTTDQIARSFSKLKESLVLCQENLYKEDDDRVSDLSKKSLKNVYKEVSVKEKERLEENKTDTEIELAIKKDLDQLKAEQEKKNKRLAARAAKKEAKRQIKEKRATEKRK